ncbi:MAG: dienelactone hydrolase family protein [Desertimonas sp.]
MANQRTDRLSLDDGTMDVHVWLPESGHGPGLVLIQEIFGVGPYIRDVAARLADAGYVVAAPDVFWRFAPGWESGHDPAGLEASMAQAANLDPETAVADCVATLGHLRSFAAPAGVMGFCLGGTLACGVAVTADPAVCVAYYGSGVPAMVGQLDQIECPTLFHFGSDDAFIPGEGVEALSAAIDGRRDLVLNVEQAGHAFDNHHSEMFYAEGAARAAWAKTTAFLAQHLPTG